MIVGRLAGTQGQSARFQPVRIAGQHIIKIMFNLFKKKREQLKTPIKEYPKYVEKYTPDKEGKGMEMHIIGEKHAIKGQPSHLTLQAIEMVKSLIDKILISRLPAILINEVREDKMCIPVREMARAFDLIIEAEKLEGNKKRWRNYKKMFCFFLENDIAWRYRWQWFMEQLDMKKIRLSEADKYFFRVKNFRVDLKEEWQEALSAYPQLKGRMAEFKEFIKVGWNGGDNRGKGDDFKLKSISEMAKKFLEIK